MTINDLFTIYKGRSYFKDFIDDPTAPYNYITTSGKNNGVKCRVQYNSNYTLFNEETITVAMQGSVLSTFIQPRKFYLQTHVAALLPKIDLSLKEKFFYALAINSHAKEFNYGRKANTTLGELEVPAPNEIPSWVYEMEIPTFDDIAESKTNEVVELPPVNTWGEFKYKELFTIQKVTGPKISEVKKTTGSTPYVSATSENNGIACYGDFEPTINTPCLTLGHLADCFYQSNPFAGNNTTALIPKDWIITNARAMFLITLINANKYKYSYGRVIGIERIKNEIIKLPITTEGTPDWDLMERYINSLPYSKYL